MADTFIQVATDGSGKKIDTRTEATNSEHRQVVVLGDPSTNAGVAAVSSTTGLAVNVTNSTLAATQSGTWTVQPGNTANTTAWKVDGSAVSQPVNLQLAGTAVTAGAGATAAGTPRVTLASDSAGVVTLGQTTKSASVPVVMASDYVTALPVGYSFTHISTATTTTAKSGAGVLHTITINALGTVASTTTVYDNTAGSGTVIAIINTLAGQETYTYDVAFATGLTLVTTGTVAPDITVSYR